MIFTQPQFKNHYYLVKTTSKVEYDLLDIYINNVQKLEDDKGYLVNIYTKQTDIFNAFDSEALAALVENSNTWFKKDLSEADIKQLYKPSICNQQKSLQVLLHDNSEICINNKPISLADFMQEFHNVSLFRKYFINLQIQHNGLYIYSKQTYNKWSIKKMNVYYDSNIDTEDKDETNLTWGSLVHECNAVLDDKINNLQNTKNKINNMYKNIIQEKNSKLWEDKITGLKQIIQNIIF